MNSYIEIKNKAVNSYKHQVESILDNYKCKYKNDIEKDIRPLLKLLGKHACLTPSWPKRFGGQSLRLSEDYFLLDAFISRFIPETQLLLSVHYAGSLILNIGSDFLKKTFLPRVASGKILLSILYTENESGSDLSTLKMQAVKYDDNHYSITGYKTFSLKSQFSDHAILAARTQENTNNTINAEHGITLFIIPLKNSAIDLRRLASHQKEQFYEVHIKSLIIHKKYILGKVDHGWSALIKGISYERIGYEYYFKAKRNLVLINTIKNKYNIDLCAKKITQYNTMLKSCQMLCDQILNELQINSKVSEYLSCISKFSSSEFATDTARYLYKLALSEKLSDPDTLNILDIYKESHGWTISAGTSEMLLETVARISLHGGYEDEYA